MGNEASSCRWRQGSSLASCTNPETPSPAAIASHSFCASGTSFASAAPWASPGCCGQAPSSRPLQSGAPSFLPISASVHRGRLSPG